MVEPVIDSSLRAVFAGRRGRLLAALMLAEFAAAIQGIAYSTVLPIASAELDGSGLYGATLAASSLTTIAVLAAGPGMFSRLNARSTLFIATGLYVAGVLFAATAVSMSWILVGSVIRGAASGLLAGFGLTVIGGLYEDALRTRVLGLFAVVWLLPSIAGPAFNTIVTVLFGWRWAMAWPAAVILLARLLVGRDAGMIPWTTRKRRLEVREGLIVLGGLVIATVATSQTGSWASPVFIVGILLSIAGAVRILHRAMGGNTGRFRVSVAFFGLCVAFFGGDGIISLAVIEGLDRGVVAGGIAIGAGSLGWSLSGLLPTRFDRRIGNVGTIGFVLLTVALGAEAVLQAGAIAEASAVVIAVVTWSLAGIGMGLAYPRLSAGAFNDLPPDRVSEVATGVAFAEITGAAVGALLGGGVYSLAGGVGVGTGASLAWPFGILAFTAISACVVRSSPRVFHGLIAVLTAMFTRQKGSVGGN